MSSTVPGGSGGGPVYNIRLTTKQLLALVGSTLLCTLAIIGTLLGVVYSGLKDDIHDVQSRIAGLETAFKSAVESGESVKSLLSRAPTLEARINETHDAVIDIRSTLNGVRDTVNGHTDALKALHTGIDQLRGQVDQMQSTIRRIPGLPR